MVSYILTAISVLLGTGKNIFSKLGSDLFEGIADYMKLNIVTSLFACLLFGALIKNDFIELSSAFIVMSLLYGACTVFSQIFFMFAVDGGAVSVCSLIYSCGFIIPTIFAGLIFEEQVTFLKSAGIVLLILCTVMVSYKKENINSGRWIISAIIAMLSSGIVGILQKTVRNCYPSWNMDWYLFCAFFFVLVVSLIVLFFVGGKKKKTNFKRPDIYVFLIAVCIVLANKLNLYLSGVLPGVVFFPCVNGGCICLSAIISKIVFREEFTKRKICGILGSIAVIIIVAHG